MTIYGFIKLFLNRAHIKLFILEDLIKNDIIIVNIFTFLSTNPVNLIISVHETLCMSKY